MHTKTHTQSDPHLVGRDLLDPAHHPEAFVTVDQGHIVGGALHWMHNGRSVNGPDPCADPPFQPVAAGEGTEHAGEKDGSPRREAELVGELASIEVIQVDLEGRLNVWLHGLLLVFTSQFCCLSPTASEVVPGRREAASPEPITTALLGYGFRARVLRTRPGMTPTKIF